MVLRQFKVYVNGFSYGVIGFQGIVSRLQCFVSRVVGLFRSLDLLLAQFRSCGDFRGSYHYEDVYLFTNFLRYFRSRFYRIAN